MCQALYVTCNFCLRFRPVFIFDLAPSTSTCRFFIIRDSAMSRSDEIHAYRPTTPTADGTSPQLSSWHLNVFSNNSRPVFHKFDQQGPGTLSSGGPRHDNDHVDIRHIQILPTTDEILAVNRPPHLPEKNIGTEPRLPNGVSRHLDVLFRHLRFEHTESLREICYHAAQTSFLEPVSGGHLTDISKRETSGGSRHFLYQDAQIEELVAHDRKGLLVRMTFNCPHFLRGRKPSMLGRLLDGMLCALLCLEHDTKALSVVFMEVHMSQSTSSLEPGNAGGRRAAVQLSFPPFTAKRDILQLCKFAQQPATVDIALVEFPKVLLAGFSSCLERLQKLSEEEVSFSPYIAPRRLAQQSYSGSEVTCQPPKYALRPSFKIDLQPLSEQDRQFHLHELQQANGQAFSDFVQRHTTLDEGQALAFRNALTREFAFVQG